MQFLNEKNIVHRDLAAKNVLLKKQIGSDNYVPKITDFGLAHIQGQPTGLANHHTAPHGPPVLSSLLIYLSIYLSFSLVPINLFISNESP